MHDDDTAEPKGGAMRRGGNWANPRGGQSSAVKKHDRLSNRPSASLEERYSALMTQEDEARLREKLSQIPEDYPQKTAILGALKNYIGVVQQTREALGLAGQNQEADSVSEQTDDQPIVADEATKRALCRPLHESQHKLATALREWAKSTQNADDKKFADEMCEKLGFRKGFKALHAQAGCASR